KDQHVAAKKSSVGAQLDRGFTPKARTIEENRLQWQEFESCARSNRQGLMDRRGRTDRSINLFRGRGGGKCRRSRRQANSDIEPITRDQPTRGGDEGGQQRISRSGAREQHPQRVALIEMGKPSGAVAMAEANLGCTPSQESRRSITDGQTVLA